MACAIESVMRRRHPLPRVWLMTDERMGDALWAALERLPRGGGVVFRHYSLPHAQRRRLFARVAQVARRRRLFLVTAGNRWLGNGDGVHNARHKKTRGIRTAAAHSRAEITRAERSAADLVFVSPVFPTRSHPDTSALGPVRLGLMIRGSRIPVVVLGGVNAERFHRLRGLGLKGWAGIDAFI